jgi:hypothetical protein
MLPQNLCGCRRSSDLARSFPTRKMRSTLQRSRTDCYVARALQVTALEKTDTAGVCLDLPTTGASVASKFRQSPELWLTGKQIHRIAAALTSANHWSTTAGDPRTRLLQGSVTAYDRFPADGGCKNATANDKMPAGWPCAAPLRSATEPKKKESCRGSHRDGAGWPAVGGLALPLCAFVVGESAQSMNQPAVNSPRFSSSAL